MSNIKNCPFCGSKNVEVFSQDEEDCPSRSAIVRCHNCDSQSPQMVGANKLSRAVSSWNKRAPVTPDDVEWNRAPEQMPPVAQTVLVWYEDDWEFGMNISDELHIFQAGRGKFVVPVNPVVYWQKLPNPPSN